MDEERRKEAAVTVADWIAAECGEQMAHDWFWELTPYPAGLPLDEQLEQGLALACAGRDAGPLFGRMRDEAEAQMVEAMAAHTKRGG